MSQKSGCEEGLCDEKLQELKLKRSHSFFANYFTRKVRASTLCTSLASRHTRLYVVLNSMCFLIPFVQCSWLLFLTFRWSFLRTVIQTPKASRCQAAKRSRRQCNPHWQSLPLQGCYAVHTQVSIAASHVHKEAAKRLVPTPPPVQTEESPAKKPRLPHDFGPDPQIRTK